VTALTLHTDVTHLVSNLASGALVATALCMIVGPGVGAWLLLASGAAGNWITAFVHGTAHRAVGASTAIFGGIGALVGLSIVRGGGARGCRSRRAWRSSVSSERASGRICSPTSSASRRASRAGSPLRRCRRSARGPRSSRWRSWRSPR
jgi:hypothetical protein